MDYVIALLIFAIFAVLLIVVRLLSQLLDHTIRLKEEIITLSVQIEEMDFKQDDTPARKHGGPEVIYVLW